jgi:hypothetical protein
MTSIPQPDADSPSTSPGQPNSLGTPLETFRAGLENLVAGIIMGVFLIVGGIVGLFFLCREVVQHRGPIPLWVDKQFSWGSVAFFGAMALGVIIGGVVLIVWVRRLFSLRVCLCPGGIYTVQRGVCQVFPWEQIMLIHEKVVQEHFPLAGLAKYAAPMGKSRSYVLYRTGGVQLALDGNSVRKIGRLGKLLREEAGKRNITWQVVEL